MPITRLAVWCFDACAICPAPERGPCVHEPQSASMLLRLAAAVATTLLLVEMASAYVSGSASAFLLRSRNPQVCSERVRVLFAGGGLRMPLANHTLGRTRALHHTQLALNQHRRRSALCATQYPHIKR